MADPTPRKLASPSERDQVAPLAHWIFFMKNSRLFQIIWPTLWMWNEIDSLDTEAALDGPVFQPRVTHETNHMVEQWKTKS
jgi:hypothetical protein